MEPGSRRPGLRGACPGGCRDLDEDDGDAGLGVIVAEPAWRRLVPRAEALARRAAAAALRESGAAAASCVLLADDRELKRLNGEHRGRDKPTNVLSFPAPGRTPRRYRAGARRGPARGRGRRASARRSISRIWSCTARCTCSATTTIAAGEARRMELAEARILHRLRLPNPWKRAR